MGQVLIPTGKEVIRRNNNNDFGGFGSNCGGEGDCGEDMGGYGSCCSPEGCCGNCGGNFNGGGGNFNGGGCNFNGGFPYGRGGGKKRKRSLNEKTLLKLLTANLKPNFKLKR